MLSFLKKIFSNQELLTDSDRKDTESENGAVKIGAGYAATQSAYQSTQKAAIKYAKPEQYTGNRKHYDSVKAKLNAKNKLFSKGLEICDPYTNDVLVLTKKEAKARYGDKWSKHLAESDHIKPIERIYEETKNKPFNTIEDIREAANSDYNIKVLSRKTNNAKRSRTNKEFVEDVEYLNDKGVKITSDGKKQALLDQELADTHISKYLKKNAFKNMIKTGHEAGQLAAKDSGVSALTMSGIMNFVSVVKGEKTTDEAIDDIAESVGNAAINGYVMGGSITLTSHALSYSKSDFLKGLAKSNVPGKVITAVAVTGDTLKKWGNGEITTQECLIELGDKGLNMATMGYAMAAGQALIPIPVVGGAIGALIGSTLTSEYYHNLINTLQTRELEHQERQRIINECNLAKEQIIAFREELECYLNNYFEDYRKSFDMALSSLQFSYEVGDSDGVIAGANEITRKLGGQVRYETVDEFKMFLDSDDDDEL